MTALPTSVPQGDIDVGKLLSKVDGLPTIPIVATQIGQLLAEDKADARSIAALLRNDQALTAKILRLINSPYYAIPGGVSDVSHAVSYLGHNTLYQLILGVSVFSILSPKDGGGLLQPRELWKHALGCAALSEELAKSLGFSNPETCFTAGLLHDVGKVALLDLVPERFQRTVGLAYDKGISLSEASLQSGLPGHETVGARLAERWRFPKSISVAMTHHRHLRPINRARLSSDLGSIVDITALANIMVRRFEFGDPGDPVVPDIDQQLLHRLNLTQTRTAVLYDDLRMAVDKSKILLDLVSQ